MFTILYFFNKITRRQISRAIVPIKTLRSQLVYLLDSIQIVHAPGLPEVLDEALAGVPPTVHVEGLAPQPGGDLVQLLVLQR